MLKPQIKNLALSEQVQIMMSKAKKESDITISDFEGITYNLNAEGSLKAGRKVIITMIAPYLEQYFQAIDPIAFGNSFTQGKDWVSTKFDGINFNIMIQLPAFTAKPTKEEIQKIKDLAAYCGTAGSYLLKYPLIMGKSCKFSIPSADVEVEVGSSVKATYTFHNQSVIML